MWQNGYSGTCGFLNREKFQATCGMLNVGLVKEFGIKEHVIAAEIILSLDIFKRKAEKIIYKEYSKFPRISKDLSLIVNNDEKCSNIEDSVMKSLRKTTPKDINIESITFFDVYSGDGVPAGMKNIGMTINYRSDKRTLLDSEVQNCFNLLQDELSKSIKIRKLS
jgi:phenylalanyl-tRNA synthetase beta chain